jgi:hypothetical protein
VEKPLLISRMKYRILKIKELTKEELKDKKRTWLKCRTHLLHFKIIISIGIAILMLYS